MAASISQNQIKSYSRSSPLPPGRRRRVPADAAFVAALQQQDLAGWKSTASELRVVDNVLTASGPNAGELYTPRDDYGDFHLRVEARISDVGMSNIAIRYPYDPEQLEKTRVGGNMVRLNGQPNNIIRTGSYMVYEQVGVRNFLAKEQLMTAGQWFNLEIIAQGNEVTTRINGRDAVSFANPKTLLNTGRIVLGFPDFGQQIVVEYRKIEIKEIKRIASPPAAAAAPA